MIKGKNSFLFFVSVIFTAAIFLILPSCKKKCSNEYCSGNGATYTFASGGLDYCGCSCNTGYEGIQCETETRTKFLGSYNFSETCSPSGAHNYIVTISASTSAVDKINIFNIYNSGLTITASVSGTSLTIASQVFASPFTISGNGNINANTLSLSYMVADGINTDNCSGAGTKP